MAACDNLSHEEEAKRAWLAKLNVPTWGAAATTLASGASEAAQMAEMSASCDAGDKVACDNLSREEEAKRAWLSKLDVPTWGAAAATLASTAADAAEMAGMTAACDAGDE